MIKNTIFSYITTPLRWIFQVTPTSLHPEEDAIKFYASFQSEYSRCSSIPQFITKKYQESVSTAYRSTKLLLGLLLLNPSLTHSQTYLLTHY